MNDIRRRQRNHLIPTSREQWCTHEHTPYRAMYGMPCTGPLICSMCNLLFDPDTKEPLPGQTGDTDDA